MQMAVGVKQCLSAANHCQACTGLINGHAALHEADLVLTNMLHVICSMQHVTCSSPGIEPGNDAEGSSDQLCKQCAMQRTKICIRRRS